MTIHTSRNGIDSDSRAAVKVLLCDGACNKLIARHTGLSVGTVKHHVASIIRETGARNRTQAAVAIVRQELGR